MFVTQFVFFLSLLIFISRISKDSRFMLSISSAPCHLVIIHRDHELKQHIVFLFKLSNGALCNL